MYYEQYEEKIRKIAQIRDKIYKFRFLILGILAFVLAVTFTLIGCKGKITKDLQLNDSYFYGESIRPKAKSFLSKPFYEYNDGTGWKEGVPTVPGEYEIRAVAKKGFGGYAYGETQEITLQKKPLLLSFEKRVTYGNDPTLLADGLVYEDCIDQGVRVTFEGFSNTPTVKLQENSLRILNGEGKIVTSYYRLQGDALDFNEIEILPRPITVQFGDGEKTYDATALTEKSFSITTGDLACEDEIFATAYSTLVKAGKKNNTASLQVMNSEGEDVTRFYAITKKQGLLTVKKREIEITTDSASKKYDALPLTAGYTITNGSLADGDTHTVLFQTALIDAEEQKNAYVLGFYNQEGEEVSDCYKVVANEGTLSITPRTLSFAFNFVEEVYNGAEHALVAPQFLPCDGTVGEDKILSLSSIAKPVNASGETDPAVAPKEVGRYALFVFSVHIWDGERDKSNNYIIDNQGGFLEITQRPIVLQLIDAKRPYDGTPFTSNAFEDVGEKYGVYSVVETHKATVQTSSKITVIGSTFNKGDTVVITDEYGEDVTHNYDWSVKNGLLTVVKRAVVVTPLTIRREYDGTALVYPTGENFLQVRWVDSENEQYGNALFGSCTASGEVQLPPLVHCGVVESSVKQNTFIIRDGTGKNITNSYYEVTFEKGQAYIYPRTIIVASQTREAKYHDGATLSAQKSDCYIQKGSLVGGDTIQFEVSASLNALGETINRITRVTIYDKLGNFLQLAQYNPTGDYYEEWSNGNYDYQIGVECGKLIFYK